MIFISLAHAIINTIFIIFIIIIIKIIIIIIIYIIVFVFIIIIIIIIFIIINSIIIIITIIIIIIIISGDRWGTSPDGTSCLGCGKQEEFYNCADIAITSDAPTSTTPAPTENPPPTQAPPGGCKGAGMWEGDPGMDEWCRMNCPANCPSSHCACD